MIVAAQGMWTRFNEKLVGGLNGELACGCLAGGAKVQKAKGFQWLNMIMVESTLQWNQWFDNSADNS